MELEKKVFKITWYQEIYWFFYGIYFSLQFIHGSLKRRIWNKHILLFWYRLWIRKDEFHISLSTDPFAMMEMNDKEQAEYMTDLFRRRKIAHLRDLEKNGPMGRIFSKLLGK